MSTDRIAICEGQRVGVDTLGAYVWVELAAEVGLRPHAIARMTPRQARRLARLLAERADELDPPEAAAASAEKDPQP